MSGLFTRAASQNTTSPMEVSLRVSTSAYGMVVPMVYGTNRVPGNMIWYGAFKAIPHTTTQEAGKGGGSSISNTTYTYTASYALALAQGEIKGIGAVWKDKDYFQANTLFTVFNGAADQEAWPYLTTNFPNQALAYRHIAYIAAANYDLGGSASMPNHSVELKGVFSNSAPFATKKDAHPYDVIEDFLTNPITGAGYPVANLGDWSSYYDYTAASNLFFSPVIDSARPAHEFLTQMAKLTNTGIYYSQGQLKAQPFGDATVTANGYTYTPNLTPVYEITDEDFIYDGNDPVLVTRGSTADAYNQVQIEFVNRANQYNVEIAEAKDQANIEAYGLRPLDVIQAHEICDAETARACAQIILQRSLYIRNTYEFTVGARFALLDPTDYVTITDTTLGIIDRPVRVTSIEETDDYTFRVTAEDAPANVSSAAIYDSEGSGGYVNDYNVAPGNTATPLIFNAPAVLTVSGLEIWMAAYGADPETWGGCEVWASYDNVSFQRIGIIDNPARMGTLTASLASGSDPDTTHTLAVNIASGLQLSSASQTDADNYATISYVDGEIMAYEYATLTGANTYNLTYLRRGGYGTPITSHSSGSTFCRLDTAVLRIPYTPDKAGKTLYLKFPAYNIYGNSLQDISTVTGYEYTIGTSISHPSNVTTFSAAYSYPDVRLTWEPADPTSNVRQYRIKVGASWAAGTLVDTVSGDSASYNAPALGIGTYTYWIAAVDDAGVESQNPQYATLTISQIAALSNVSVTSSYGAIAVKFTLPTAADFGGVNVYLSTTSGFTPGPSNLVYTGPDSLIVIGRNAAGNDLVPGTTYYVRVAPFSKLGTSNLNLSSQLSAAPIAPTQVAVAALYQWAASQPGNPSGNSTFTWATAINSNYTGENGWEVAIPSNPGTSGIQLWQATTQVVGYPTDATTTVSWSTGYGVKAISSNGGVGTSAKLLRLVATGNAITFDSTGAASPSSQTLSFTAILENMSGTATFTADRYNSSNVKIDSITLGSSGNTRTLTNTQFGAAAYCVITATLSDQSDIQRVVRLADGDKGNPGDPGENAITGLLTNEAAVVAASSDGTVSSFSNAGGTFKVYDGTTDKTGDASVTYSVVSGSATGVTISIASTGVYTISGMSADTGTATLRAVYGGVTIDKTYSIAKSKQGGTGGPGTSGLQSAKPTVYQWGTSTPAGPSGTAIYTWATGEFGAAPSGWSLTPGDGSLGQTLYAAGVAVTDSASNATTAFNWTSASISIAGYKGTNGTNGNPGSNGTRTAVLSLYQWASATPTTFPSGTSTYTWADGTYTAPATLNSWALDPGSGTAGQTLYEVQQAYSDTSTSATSTVTWASSTALVIGKAGTNGSAGTRYGFAKIYRWGTSTPSSYPSGDWIYTWATGAAAMSTGKANGWSSTPPAPIAGYTLYQGQAVLADSTSDATTTFSWATATKGITPISYAGATGNQGASMRTCYSRIANNPTPTSGSITVTGDARPTQTQSNTTWGLNVTWSASDPDPASTNTLYQSDGIYDPATGNTVWTTPYISSLKVGSLSAVSTNTGSLTVSGTMSTANGNFSVDENGNVTIRNAASGARLEIGNNVIKVFDSNGIKRVQIGDLSA